MSHECLNEVIAYLDSVSPLYPGGVPLALRSPSLTAVCKVLFLVDSSEVKYRQGELTGPSRELLQSIIEKGVRLAGGEYQILEVDNRLGLSEQQLQQQLDAHNPAVIISFGILPPLATEVSTAPGKLLTVFNKNFLLTIPLTQAGEHTGKRSLWNDLKLILPYLEKAGSNE